MDSLKNVWPEWQIEDELGEGAFGKVYKIKREDMGGTFYAALKVIQIPKDQNEVSEIMTEGITDHISANHYFQSLAEEIVKEFALMERLKGNTNIVAYEDHKVIAHEDRVGWDIYIRMELLTSLTSYMAEYALSEQDAIQIGIDICKALEVCQKHHVIHRDIKPENIFVSEIGDYKLGDFGVARTAEKTMSGMSKKGTYTYMAPEVYKGEPYNASVDIYSLGIVMYRLANDYRTPFLPLPPARITFNDRENAQMRRMDGEAIPDPIRASKEFAAVIRKATAYDPRDRYDSPAQMRADLEALLRGERRNVSALSKNKAHHEVEADDRTVILDDGGRNTSAKAVTAKPAPVKKTTIAPPPQKRAPEKKVRTNPLSNIGNIFTNFDLKQHGLFVGLAVAAIALLVSGIILGISITNKNGTGVPISTVSENVTGEKPVSGGNSNSNVTIEDVSDEYHILAKTLSYDEQGRAFVPEKHQAMEHDNSYIPPISLFGTWVMEDYSDNEAIHPAEGTRMEVSYGTGDTVECEFLPYYMLFEGYMDIVDLLESTEKDIEDQNLMGMCSARMKFYENSSDENHQDEDVTFDGVFDTHGNILAMGIPYGKDASQKKICEIKYEVEWVGWKLKLKYGDYAVTYVPYLLHENSTQSFHISKFTPVSTSSAINDIVYISKNEFRNAEKKGTVEISSPEYHSRDAVFEFNEDGSLVISTDETLTAENRFPQATYEYQYRLSAESLTLITPDQMSIYSLQGTWWEKSQ